MMELTRCLVLRVHEVARKARAALPKILGTPHLSSGSTWRQAALVGLGVESNDSGAAWHETGKELH
jgi:hypothetical protein